VRAQSVAVAVEPIVRTVPLVSPLRGGGVTGTIDVVVRAGSTPPAVPAAGPAAPAQALATPGPRVSAPAAMPTPATPPVPASVADAPSDDDEPPWPEEAQRREAAAADRPTAPLEAGSDRTLHVRFGPAPMERVVEAFGVLKEVFAGRPGETAVVLHVPAGGGREQPMQLRGGVAYDAELLRDIERRVGGLVRLELA
jgi:hypothetical protein